MFLFSRLLPLRSNQRCCCATMTTKNGRFVKVSDEEAKQIIDEGESDQAMEEVNKFFDKDGGFSEKYYDSNPKDQEIVISIKDSYFTDKPRLPEFRKYIDGVYKWVTEEKPDK